MRISKLVHYPFRKIQPLDHILSHKDLSQTWPPPPPHTHTLHLRPNLIFFIQSLKAVSSFQDFRIKLCMHFSFNICVQRDHPTTIAFMWSTLTKSGEEQNYEAARYVVFPAGCCRFSLRSISYRLEGLNKTARNLILGSRFGNRDSNSVPPKHISGMIDDLYVFGTKFVHNMYTMFTVLWINRFLSYLKMLYQLNVLYGIKRQGEYELFIRNNSLTRLEELRRTSNNNTNNPKFLSGFQLALENLRCIFSIYSNFIRVPARKYVESVLKLTHRHSPLHSFDSIFHCHPLKYLSPTIFSDWHRYYLN
jgi:hypothetical protein